METSPLLLTVEDIGHRLNVSRSVVFELLRSNELKSVKIGRSRRIPADSLAAYVAALVAEQGGAA